MKKSRFVSEVFPVASDENDIEAYTAAAKMMFGPFVRRKTVIQDERHLFRSEMVNLGRVFASPELSDALLETVRLGRRAIYRNRAAAFSHMLARFPAAATADGSWLTFCSANSTLQEFDHEQDLASARLRDLSQIAEACVRPRISILFGFAVFHAKGSYPAGVPDFGQCIRDWPQGQAPKLQRLFYDPLFGIPVSQWRNIGAHASFFHSGKGEIDVSYGKGTPQRQTIAIADLSRILGWLIDLLYVVRLAAVILYLEFMPELRKIGIPEIPVRWDAFILRLSHDSRMVGFEYAGEARKGNRIVLFFSDHIGREIKRAIIHLSQFLISLPEIIDNDPSFGSEIDEVAIVLVEGESKIASALVRCEAIRNFLTHKLTQKQYIAHIRFRFAPAGNQ